MSGSGEDVRLQLYFFWTATCPHCQVARPFVEALAQRHPWLDVDSRELGDDPANPQLFVTLGRELDERVYSVPAFFFCGQLVTGFDRAETSGVALETALLECRDAVSRGGNPWETAGDPEGAAGTTTLPVLGAVSLDEWSLPLVAVTLGALDSFNPCAFFVLLFLLSLLVNARSRRRMLLIGGLFVLVSGVVYFLFMAAWLNVFLLFGELRWMTAAAGALAVLIGGINVKDYAAPGRGPSLSIPEGAKPTLFRRIRRLVNAESLVTMIAGTLVLAVLANTYELLCTAGFPMVFTRLLTLQPLSSTAYYGYLLLYCAVYIVPLLAIVGAFVATLGRRKLSEREGRLLKLLSGLMMLGLGTVLLAAPALVSNLAVTAGLLASTGFLTWLISRLHPLGRA